MPVHRRKRGQSISASGLNPDPNLDLNPDPTLPSTFLPILRRTLLQS
jgi:hypothetical protein